MDWHPHKGLLASGGKDSLTILWDAREGKKAVDIHAHKNQVTCLKWNANGNWLATGCKDQTIKVFDIRTMKELENFRGHTRDVTAVVWHPRHEALLTSGGYDGTIMYWIVGRGQEECAAPGQGRARGGDLVDDVAPGGSYPMLGPTTTPPSSGAGTGLGRCRGTRRFDRGAYMDVVEPPTLGGGGGRVPARGRERRGVPSREWRRGPPPPAPPPGAPRGAPPPAPPPGRADRAPPPRLRRVGRAVRADRRLLLRPGGRPGRRPGSAARARGIRGPSLRGCDAYSVKFIAAGESFNIEAESDWTSEARGCEAMS